MSDVGCSANILTHNKTLNPELLTFNFPLSTNEVSLTLQVIGLLKL